MSKSPFITAMAWGASILVGISLVVAFWVVGSPAEARKKSADQDRLGDLHSIADDVRGYYRDKKALPRNVAEMNPNSYTFEQTYKDPVTRQAYAYEVVDKDHFSICATFDTDISKKSRSEYTYYEEELGPHPAGPHCYVLPAISTAKP